MVVFLWWCGGGVLEVVFLRWWCCGSVFVVVLWLCFGGCVVVLLWWCFCGGVFAVSLKIVMQHWPVLQVLLKRCLS